LIPSSFLVESPGASGRPLRILKFCFDLQSSCSRNFRTADLSRGCAAVRAVRSFQKTEQRMPMPKRPRDRRILLIGFVASLCIGYWLSGPSELKLHHRGNRASTRTPWPRAVASTSDSASERSTSEHAPPKPLLRSAIVAADRMPTESESLEHDRQRLQGASRSHDERRVASRRRGAVIPPSYRERMALLDEEREVVTRRAEREGTQPSPLYGESDIVQTSDNGESASTVEQALAEVTETASPVRVTPVSVRFVEEATDETSGPRGAWLAGVIETE